MTVPADLSTKSDAELQGLVAEGKLSQRAMDSEMRDRIEGGRGPDARADLGGVANPLALTNTPSSGGSPASGSAPLSEPAQYRAANVPGQGPAGGGGIPGGESIGGEGNHLPRGAGNQYAAMLGLPHEGVEKPTDAPATFVDPNSIAAGPNPAANMPGAGGAAADGFGAGDPNEVRSQSSSGSQQTLESPQHRAAMGEAAQSAEARAAAVEARAQHAYEAGRTEAAARQGQVDQMSAESAAHQAKVDARGKQLADAESRRKAASDAFQEESKNGGLGTMLHPTSAQAVGSAIAIALGAIGSGLTGGPNAALQVLDKQLDAAKSERFHRLQGKREAINAEDKNLEELHRIYGDEDAAWLAHKADVKDLAAGRIETAAALSGAQDKLDAGAQASAEIRQSSAMDRAAAAQRYEKTVRHETTTSSESGPSIAAKARMAQYQLMEAKAKAEGRVLPSAEQVEKQGTMQDKWTNLKTAIAKNGSQIPPAVVRQMMSWGASVHDWSSAAANIAADTSMTQEERNLASAIMDITNTQINKDSGKQVTPNEAPRLYAGYGIGPSATAKDVVNGLGRLGSQINASRARMEEQSPELRRVFTAGEMSMEGQQTRPYPGRVSGQP